MLGQRIVRHPVRPATRWVSVRLQANDAADPLMTVAHGHGWRQRAGVVPGRRRRHLVTTAFAIWCARLSSSAVGGPPLSSLQRAGPPAARSSPGAAHAGPRTPDEILTMLITSIVIPPAAVWHWFVGWLRLPGS